MRFCERLIGESVGTELLRDWLSGSNSAQDCYGIFSLL
ncbi:hypothetical protein pah_c045o069 [Parachlamydia acanthamoebae str. Hall's coccus]|nr:hypothetical protein pah_c045o069 [Parachlamydia acanthamoebae str. Hall's coccus]